MNLKQLEYFVAVAELGSFSKAAVILNIAQPALSRQVRLLTLPLVEGFRRTLPKARLAIVEGLTAHLAEWISTGRVDLGLLHNPEPHSALEVMPVLEEPLGLVSPAAKSGGKAVEKRTGKKVSLHNTATQST